MDAISSATQTINAGFARFERASENLVASVSGGNADAGQAIADQVEAKAQVQAGVGTVRIADEMFKALIAIGLETSSSQ